MWKLLRNLLLWGLVLGIGLKLALWTAAQQQAQWLADSVAKWGVLSWSGAGGTFAGDIRLSGVSFQPRADFGLGAISAASLTVRTPGVLWLLRRAITRDTSVPEQLGLSLRDASLPGLDKLAGGGEMPWFGARSLVPFETFACGASRRLDMRDYVSMRIQPALPRLDFDYRLDEDGELGAGLEVYNAPFATVRLRVELRHFSAQLLDSAAAREALRIASVDLQYRDDGYLDRRNQFCARQTGVDVNGYVERHIAELQERLKAEHMVPAEGVVEIYRSLLLHSGELKLLSLPREDIAPAQYDTYDPEEVLRWLNLTARHNDAPPVLFKLFFLAEPVQALAGIDRALVHDPLAEPEPETVVVRPEENPVLATTTGTTQSAEPASKPAPRPTDTPAPAMTDLLPEAPAAQASTPVTAARLPDPPPLRTAPPAEPAADGAVVATPQRRSNIVLDPRLVGVPSAPPPPPGSTAALVWKGPRIDRLPENKTAERPRPFAVIGYEGLSGQIGQRVVVITNAGKEIDGKVSAVDGEGVTLQVNRETGQARLQVERKRILEIRVPRKG
jgi:hypothetical protein